MHIRAGIDFIFTIMLYDPMIISYGTPASLLPTDVIMTSYFQQSEICLVTRFLHDNITYIIAARF